MHSPPNPVRLISLSFANNHPCRRSAGGRTVPPRSHAGTAPDAPCNASTGGGSILFGVCLFDCMLNGARLLQRDVVNGQRRGQSP